MIDKTEVLDFAKALSLTAEIVEKDYVLGWLLAGINGNTVLEDKWVFKGGTCLKKCYFETYRFSEDLDFTITDEKHIDKDFLLKQFSSIADWIYDNSGIQIVKDQFTFDVHPDPTKKYVEGRVRYIGPLGERRGGHARIILDLTSKELLALPSERKKVFHPYSDQPHNGIHARSYSFEEVFAEKVRALKERARPRDLYDVVHLYRRDAQVDKSLLVDTLKRKCEFKSVDLPNADAIRNHPRHSELLAQWSSMLKHQLSALPPIESFLDELDGFFDWLYEDESSIAKEDISSDQENISSQARTPSSAKDTDQNWSVPDRLLWPSEEATRLEKIRFAAANQLCLEIIYTKKNGETNKYSIEPYAVTRSIAGELYLDAMKTENGENRRFTLSMIREINITEKPFKPRFPIEVFGGQLRIRQNQSRRTSSSIGPKYVYRCTTCRRLFYKKSMDGSLRDHKNKRGQPCYGRYGHYVRTKWR